MSLQELESLVRAARNQVFYTGKRGRPAGSLDTKPRKNATIPKVPRERRPEQDGSRSAKALELLLTNKTRTYQDIAQEIGSTRELVRQIAKDVWEKQARPECTSGTRNRKQLGSIPQPTSLGSR